jgi:MFS family permease
MRGRDAETLAVLARTSDAPAEAGDRLEEIRRAVSQAQLTGGGNTKENNLLAAVQSSPITRRIFTNVLALQFFRRASGIDAIVLYSPLVFKKSGMSSNGLILGATVAVGVVKTCSIFVATFLSDRVGRRPLLLASTAGVAVTLTTTLTMAACFASVLAYVAAFSVGLGPLTQAYSAEVLPLRLRAQGTGLGTAVNRLTCGVLSMTFISLAGSVTMAGCFFLYAGMMVVACVFVYVRLPETKGRSLEDMDVLFAK